MEYKIICILMEFKINILDDALHVTYKTKKFESLFCKDE
jgi:hypothetical protein